MNRMRTKNKDGSWGPWIDLGCRTFRDDTPVRVVEERKPEPYDPCPCGSGKKYRFCCQGK